MTDIPKHITDAWPFLRRWPIGVGPLPSANNVGQTAMLVRRGTAVHMSLAMYMRAEGATDEEAGRAAAAATGAQSKTHRVRRDELVHDGILRRIDLAKRNGNLAVRVELVSRIDRASLTHITGDGSAHMVDVGGKDVTERTARAEGCVTMRTETLATILSGNAKKGDVLGTARIAGIMAAKKTHELIPLCHPLLLNNVTLDIEPDQTLPGLRVSASVRVSGKTGVEMEALTAVSIACLTIYDMAKAIDRGMEIGGISLVEKSGGKSGDYRRDAD